MMVMMVTADERPERRRYKDTVMVMMVMVVVMAELSQLHARANNSAPSVVHLQCRDSIWDWRK